MMNLCVQTNELLTNTIFLKILIHPPGILDLAPPLVNFNIIKA